jgi:nucleoporin NUP42
VLENLDGAVKFIVDAANQHPNRIDIVAGHNQSQLMTTRSPIGPSNTTFGQPGNATINPLGRQPTSAFGQPSSLGGSTSVFGQPSAFGGKSPFAQPTQTGGTNSFSRPSALGQSQSPFAKPAQPGGGSAFGQPSSLGQTSSPFGQVQPNTSSAFGQSTPFGSAATNSFSNATAPPGGFGQPQQLVQTPFGQPQPQQQPQQHQQQPSSPFGQPSQQSNGPFGQPFQVNSFGQPSSNAPGPTGANPLLGNWAKDSTGNPTNFPIKDVLNPNNPSSQMSHPDIRTYSVRDPDNKILAWKGKEVSYIDNEPYWKKDGTNWEKIWFPNGPPGYTSMTELNDEKAYDPKVKEAYLHVKEHGSFKDGLMPIVPPKREWCSWDF